MDNELNVFLLIGQSNMAGRGRLSEVPALADPQVWMFRDGCWITAEEPLHTDRPEIAGVGLGMSFAVELVARDHLAPIGLVPCAMGGSSLRRWMPEADLYENAVALTQRALSRGTLKGVLWHQGESDSGNADDASTYGQRLQSMVGSLCLQLAAERVPVIAGQLGMFLQNRADCSFFNVVNQQLRELEARLPAYGCVSAQGLADNGDGLHFNSQSLREFGRRYADIYIKIARRGENTFEAPLDRRRLLERKAG